MANIELQLISNIIKKGTLKDLKSRGMTSEILQTSEAKELLDWLSDQHADPRHPGEVPSLDRVHRHFPDFDYCPSRDSIGVLVSDIVARSVAEGIRTVTEEIDDLLEEGEDPSMVLQAYLPQLRDLNIQGGARNHMLISKGAKVLREEYHKMQVAGGITGIPFPWAPLNKSTAGMQDEDFIVIYGRPKNMKTWLACAIAAHAYSRANKRVLVYSKEMNDTTMMRRIASIIAEVDYQRLKSGTLRQDEADEFFDVLDGLEDWEKKGSEGGRASMSFLSDRKMRGKKGATVDVIAAEAERFEADLVIVDGFYLMRDGRTGVKSRDWKQISNISSDLKNMGQMLQVPVIGTTQANRTANDSRGDDLAELGFADAIGQDADLVMRCFKGKNRATGKPKIMLTFPGVRDAVLYPFVVNAWPGADFSLLQSTVDVGAFLADKKGADEEEDKKSGRGGGKAPASSSGSGTPRKRQKRQDPKTRVR